MLFAELRFSHAEATEVLHRLAPSLSEEQMHATAERADGLAVGLQLAALNVRAARVHEDGFAPASAADRLVHGYMIHEVLAAEAPELINLLLDISVVDRVNPSLAATLTGRSDADAMLRRAEERGLFVSTIDPIGWFELYSVARAALLAELERRTPHRPAEQHLRAAGRRFEDADEVVLALGQYVLAGRPREALRLRDQASRALRRRARGHDGPGARRDPGRSRVFGPRSDARARALLPVDQPPTLPRRGRPGRVLGRAIGPLLEPLVRARLAIVQSMAVAVDGRTRECGDYAAQGPRAVRRRLVEGPLRSVRLEHDCARDRVVRAVGRQRRRRTRGAVVARPAAGTPHRGSRQRAHWAPLWRAAPSTLPSGSPACATSPVSSTRRSCVRRSASPRRWRTASSATVRGAWPSSPRSPTRPPPTMLFCKVLALVELAQAFLDDGSTESAMHAFGRAQGIVDMESFGPLGRSSVAALDTRLALAEGRLEDAHRAAARVEDPFWKP